MIKRTEAALVVGLILSAFAVSASGQSSDQGRRPPVLRSTSPVPDNQDQAGQYKQRHRHCAMKSLHSELQVSRRLAFNLTSVIRIGAMRFTSAGIAS